MSAPLDYAVRSLVRAYPPGVAIVSQLDAIYDFAFKWLTPRERMALAALLHAAADQLVPPTAVQP